MHDVQRGGRLLTFIRALPSPIDCPLVTRGQAGHGARDGSFGRCGCAVRSTHCAHHGRPPPLRRPAPRPPRGVRRAARRGAAGCVARAGAVSGHRAWRRAVARALERHRPVRQRFAGRTARRRAGVRTAVHAVVRRRRQAALDLAAARHVDRRVAARCMAVPARHQAVEGIQPRRPSRRDAHHRAPGRRLVALRHVRVERGRHRSAARAGARRHACTA